MRSLPIVQCFAKWVPFPRCVPRLAGHDNSCKADIKANLVRRSWGLTIANLSALRPWKIGHIRSAMSQN